ncbi:hypothetical protein GQ464_014170 [Rhodocaloribacter litoris]|uniref:hypothetical protein n=1 Tax=Rhodocaloribacter litoris TaxID=2558931 RepID=UPI00141F3444|nr:hypothetical protein [Rhodocaloribacter litoris]QXD14565.1 hypothetical protein GQ464_014170 [Rhodocaloribacter litoris]GIV59665.1 MAG: hypothetical protein KatS3mg043_0754 [Rhodothermaceae bacterium]
MGQGTRIALQVVLGIVILVLAYFLYVSITEPYQAVERQRELTRLTRERMDDVRQALVYYRQVNERFPRTLDSLVMFLKTDSLAQARTDSLFGEPVNFDSLIYSPRTGKPFEYALNDTSQVMIYLLKDPDSDDQIGSLIPDVTLLNAASWE